MSFFVSLKTVGYFLTKATSSTSSTTTTTTPKPLSAVRNCQLEPLVEGSGCVRDLAADWRRVWSEVPNLEPSLSHKINSGHRMFSQQNGGFLKQMEKTDLELGWYMMMGLSCSEWLEMQYDGQPSKITEREIGFTMDLMFPLSCSVDHSSLSHRDYTPVGWEKKLKLFDHIF